MPFHVICLETSEPYRHASGNIVVFETGGFAAQLARELSEETSKKWQPRPIIDNSWISREQARFDSGEYEGLPWNLVGYWKNDINADCLFPHVSKKFPGKIAFTENAAKGAADIQTAISPGRFLERFTTMGEHIRKELANEFTAKYSTDSLELLFARTADEIEDVYLTGPESCMSKPANRYDSSVHPVRVYAAGDLAVAYLQTQPDDDSDPTIVARCVCWPEELIYTRIYGRHGANDKLQARLNNLGYKSGDLEGARLQKIDDGDGQYVMPYLDQGLCFNDNGDYFAISVDGEFAADNTNGLTSLRPRCTCDNCGDPMDEDDQTYIESREENWCEHCVENYAFYDEYRSETIPCNNGVWIRDLGEYWSQRRFENYGFVCEETGDSYSHDAMVVLADDTVVCQRWADRNAWYCEECDQYFRNGDLCNCEPEETEEKGDE